MTNPEAVQGMQDLIDIYTKGYVPTKANIDGFNEIRVGDIIECYVTEEIKAE